MSCPRCCRRWAWPASRTGLDLAPVGCTVVLLVDGLGWTLVTEHARYAPFLSSLTGRPLTAGFPTTTAASITSLGTGVLPGEHGIVGYTTHADGLTEPVNWLTWRGAHSGRDVSEDHPPTVVQPVATAFERAERAGVAATVVSAPMFRESGLTRAALRGGQFIAPSPPPTPPPSVAEAARPPAAADYCYSPDLDLIGHVHGCRSEAWQAQLELIDTGVQLLADRLPAGTRLLVTGDHGMLDVADADKVDYDAEPLLHRRRRPPGRRGPGPLSARRRGPTDDVRDRWTQILGDRFDILTRDEAIHRGWFGPVVSAPAT